MSKTWDRFIELVNDEWALASTDADLYWYNITIMPEGEEDIIAFESGVLAKHKQRIISSNEMGDLISRLGRARLQGDNQVIYNKVSREYNRLKPVPPELAAELGKLHSKGESIWRRAKEKNKFGIVAPVLEEIIELERRRAGLIDPTRHPFEVMMQEEEPDFTLAEVNSYFDVISRHLAPLNHAVSTLPRIDAPFLKAQVDNNKKLIFIKQLAKALGFDFSMGIIGESEHPMYVGSRFTIRRGAGLWEAITDTMHEAAHAIYDQNLPRKKNHYFDPLGTQASSSVNEGIASLYQYHIGLSRAFWRGYFPKMRRAFPELFKGVDFDEFYSAINGIKSGFRNVNDDELATPLNIILRVKLEQRLMDGRLPVKDAPREWNESSKRYLGQKPPNDRQGILRTNHWYDGQLGDYPPYLLADVVAPQLFNAMLRDIPEIEYRIGGPELKQIKAWLTNKIFRHGARYDTKELIERATGKPLGPHDYINYLYRKFSDLYGLPIEMNGKGFYRLSLRQAA